jgi:hypothetical protein
MNKLGQLYFDAAGGNHNAVVFITAFHAYCHAIDDLVDGDVPFTPEAFLDVMMQANSLYSTPFYIDNWFRLQPVIAQITSTYADSVAWEKADEEWKRQTADVLRLCGNDMILQVAWIIGGYKHMSSSSGIHGGRNRSGPQPGHGYRCHGAGIGEGHRAVPHQEG